MSDIAARRSPSRSPSKSPAKSPSTSPATSPPKASSKSSSKSPSTDTHLIVPLAEGSRKKERHVLKDSNILEEEKNKQNKDTNRSVDESKEEEITLVVSGAEELTPPKDTLKEPAKGSNEAEEKAIKELKEDNIQEEKEGEACFGFDETILRQLMNLLPPERMNAAPEDAKLYKKIISYVEKALANFSTTKSILDLDLLFDMNSLRELAVLWEMSHTILHWALMDKVKDFLDKALRIVSRIRSIQRNEPRSAKWEPIFPRHPSDETTNENQGFRTAIVGLKPQEILKMFEDITKDLPQATETGADQSQPPTQSLGAIPKTKPNTLNKNETGKSTVPRQSVSGASQQNPSTFNKRESLSNKGTVSSRQKVVPSSEVRASRALKKETKVSLLRKTEAAKKEEARQDIVKSRQILFDLRDGGYERLYEDRLLEVRIMERGETAVQTIVDNIEKYYSVGCRHNIGGIGANAERLKALRTLLSTLHCLTFDELLERINEVEELCAALDSTKEDTE